MRLFLLISTVITSHLISNALADQVVPVESKIANAMMKSAHQNIYETSGEKLCKGLIELQERTSGCSDSNTVSSAGEICKHIERSLEQCVGLAEQRRISREKAIADTPPERLEMIPFQYLLPDEHDKIEAWKRRQQAHLLKQRTDDYSLAEQSVDNPELVIPVISRLICEEERWRKEYMDNLNLVLKYQSHDAAPNPHIGMYAGMVQQIERQQGRLRLRISKYRRKEMPCMSKTLQMLRDCVWGYNNSICVTQKFRIMSLLYVRFAAEFTKER